MHNYKLKIIIQITDFYREKLLKKTKVMKLADQVHFSSLIFKISKNILI